MLTFLQKLTYNYSGVIHIYETMYASNKSRIYSYTLIPDWACLITTLVQLLHSLEIALTIRTSYMQPNYWPRKAAPPQMARNVSTGTPAT